MTDRDDQAATPPVPPASPDGYRDASDGSANASSGTGYAAPDYAQPQPYGGVAGYGSPAPKKTLSLIGMILGIVGVLGAGIVVIPFIGSFLGLFFPVSAVVLGFLGRRKEGAPAKGFWLTALITGFVAVGIALIAFIGWIGVAVVGQSGSLG